MAKFNTKVAKELLDAKFESVEVTDDDTDEVLFTLVAPVRLEREKRKALSEHLKSRATDEDEDAPEVDEDEKEREAFAWMRDLVILAADEPIAAEVWLDEVVGDDVLYLSELVNYYFKASQPGEAVPSVS